MNLSKTITFGPFSIWKKYNLNRFFLKSFLFGLVRIERGVSITAGQNFRALI